MCLGSAAARADTGDAAPDVVNPLIVPQVGGGRRVGRLVGLVPLDPAGAGAAVVGPAGHHGPGEAAGAAVVVAQEHGSEGDRRHVEADLHEVGAGFGVRVRGGDFDAGLGWESVRPDVLGDRQRRRREHQPALGLLDISKEDRDADVHADVGQVDPGAVVEAHGAPAPSKGPPVPHAPRVVALALPVDGERLAADGDGAGDEAGDLVAGGQVVVVGDAVGRPGEIEVETRRRTGLLARRVDGLWRVDEVGRRAGRQAERFEWAHEFDFDPLVGGVVGADGRL